MSADAFPIDVIEGRARWCVVEGDCLDPLASLPNESIDSVITDPPYCSGGATEAGRARATGQGLRSETLRSGRFAWFDSDNMTSSGLVFLLRTVAVEAFRALKDGGSMVVFMDWRMVPALVPALESSGLRYQNLLVWNKESMGLGRGFRMQHELAAHLTKGVGVYYSMSTSNVLSTGRTSRVDRAHPTEKPVDLIRDICRVVTPLNGVVCDPFAGSGATPVAALSLGMRAVSSERDARYVGIARSRCDAELEQCNWKEPRQLGLLGTEVAEAADAR